MNYADWVVLGSIILTVAPVAYAAHQYYHKDNVYGAGEVLPFLWLAAWAIFLPDINLRNSFVFGLIAGTLIQPVADVYLTSRTLKYGGKSWRIFKTPYWMACLWGVALTQLSYFYFRLPTLMVFLEMPVDGWARYAVFVASGFFYFFIFELVVNNMTNWWERRNCWQPLRVAVYAMVAELATVMILPLFLRLTTLSPDHYKYGQYEYYWVLFVVAFNAGVAIMLNFVFFCRMFYKERR